MGSQLNLQPASLTSDQGAYEYPLIHAGAAPTYTYPAELPPTRCVRLATRPPPLVDTSLPSQPFTRDIDSAPLCGAFPQSPHTDHVASQQMPATLRSTSVPPSSRPEQTKRGRKKKKKARQPTQSDPFILEHMPFPEHQPWLKVRPRQRRSAVEAARTTSAFPPASDAPDQGESLMLGKHADRIAALIFKKRRENDSTQFRQRMALQQRLHRGEKDELDKVIAASHDELKRKMELSAQGIYEEEPPDGMDLEFGMADRSSTGSADDTDSGDVNSYSEFDQDHMFSGGIQASPDLRDTYGRNSMDPSDEEIDGEYGLPGPAHPYDSQPPILGPYVHYSQSAYYQHNVLTNRLLSLSNAASQNGSAENIYAPPSYNQQYPASPGNWSSAQPWTSQMYQALPSTQTPEAERAEIVGAGQHMDSYEPYQRDHNIHINYPQTHDLYDYHASANHSVSTTNTSSSSSTPAVGIARMNYQVNLPPNTTSMVETDVLAPRANVNIFTRQARENGVIGGNNNVVIPPAPRRNMFDRG